MTRLFVSYLVRFNLIQQFKPVPWVFFFKHSKGSWAMISPNGVHGKGGWGGKGKVGREDHQTNSYCYPSWRKDGAPGWGISIQLTGNTSLWNRPTEEDNHPNLRNTLHPKADADEHLIGGKKKTTGLLCMVCKDQRSRGMVLLLHLRRLVVI